MAECSHSAAESDIDIHTIYKPDNCQPEQKNVVKEGHYLIVHYNVTLENGEHIDSTLSRNKPLRFQVGTGQINEGFEEGLLGMCVREIRKIMVPPHLTGSDSTVHYTVQLLAIEHGDERVIGDDSTDYEGLFGNGEQNDYDYEDVIEGFENGGSFYDYEEDPQFNTHFFDEL